LEPDMSFLLSTGCGSLMMVLCEPKHVGAVFIVAPCILKIHKLSKTNKCTNTSCIILKHTLKYLKGSYMFLSTIILREHIQFLAEVLKC
jgi:hypothetical protein